MEKFLEALIIFVASLLPFLFTLLLFHQAEAQTRTRLQAARERVTRRQFQNLAQSLDPHHIPGVGRMIGDISCQFNARSTYIRCAVNPSGPCDECSHYRPKEEDTLLKGSMH